MVTNEHLYTRIWPKWWDFFPFPHVRWIEVSRVNVPACTCWASALWLCESPWQCRVVAGVFLVPVCWRKWNWGWFLYWRCTFDSRQGFTRDVYSKRKCHCRTFCLLWRNMTATRGDVHSTRRVHAHAHSLAGSGFVSLARYGGVRDPFSHDMLSPVVSRVFSVLYLFVLSI